MASKGWIASTYLGRYAMWLRPTNYDHSRMPQRPILASAMPVSLPTRPAPISFETLPVVARGTTPPVPLARLLADSGTTAYVILREGQVLWEHYPNGGARERLNRCFSVTKSFASALVGSAIAAGAITSVEEPIGTYLPGLRDPRVARLTIAHLLEMRSGIRFVEGVAPWHDAPRTYYATDMRQRLLNRRIGEPIGSYFHYNDWHPQLLSLIIERATGKSVTAWLQERLWNPLGAEYPACMMVDRDGPEGVEHLESGLTATAIDLAKFGQLYLQDGNWLGEHLLPAGWVDATTAPRDARMDAEWFAYYRNRPWGRVFARGRTYYRRMWWGYRPDETRHDFFAMGVLGQHIYVSPDTRTVQVRLSDRFPPRMWWPPVFRQIAEAVAAVPAAGR